ncbi:hypothetical protein Chor_013361 [Crotalus horridus]
MAKPVDFFVFNVLVTGSTRGIGLGLVKRFLELPCPPKWVFATTLDLEGEDDKELRELACKYPNLVVLQLGSVPSRLEAKAPAPREMAKSVDFCIFSVLVTGSDRGIGLGLVKRFLELPCPPKWVFATTLDLEGEDNKEVKELACKHPNLVVLQLEVEKCVGEGGLTLLVNNAGIRLFNDLETENAKDMMRVYSTNTIGPLQMSQAFLPLLKKAARRNPQEGLSCSKAAIINISSAGGSMEVMLLWPKLKIIGYRCSKTALNMLTRCQSLEYPRHGILSVCIHPGWVKTVYKDVSTLTWEKKNLLRHASMT